MCCHGQNQLNGHRLCFRGKCLLINPSLTAQILVQPASPFDCPTNHSPCILSDKPICSKWVSYPEATILIHVLFVISSSYLVFMEVQKNFEQQRLKQNSHVQTINLYSIGFPLCLCSLGWWCSSNHTSSFLCSSLEISIAFTLFVIVLSTLNEHPSSCPFLQYNLDEFSDFKTTTIMKLEIRFQIWTRNKVPSFLSTIASRLICHFLSCNIYQLISIPLVTITEIHQFSRFWISFILFSFGFRTYVIGPNFLRWLI